MTSAVTPGRVMSAGAKPGTLSIAGMGAASSRVGVCAHEPHKAFILGALLRGGNGPFEAIFLAGVAEAAAGRRRRGFVPQGINGFEADDAVSVMASGDCVAGLQVRLRDVPVFLRRDFDDLALVVDGHATSGWHRILRR